MYSRTFWKDHVVDDAGSVIQQGTNMSQDNFNNEELGIFESAVANCLNSVYLNLRADDEKNTEITTVTQTLASGSNSVALPDAGKRNNADYTVIPVFAAAPSVAVTVAVTAKQANGFTVSSTGAATVAFLVQGGML